MYAFSVTSVPLCRSHTEMYLNCLHSQYAIVNHISDIDTANMTLGKRGKTIVHRFYYKHDQILAERAALQPHFDHTAASERESFTIKTKFVQIRMFIESSALSHSRAAIRTDFLPFRLLWYQPLPESEQETSPESQQRSVLADQAQCSDVAYGYSRKRICIYRKYACSNLYKHKAKDGSSYGLTCILYSGRFEEG